MLKTKTKKQTCFSCICASGLAAKDIPALEFGMDRQIKVAGNTMGEDGLGGRLWQGGAVSDQEHSFDLWLPPSKSTPALPAEPS